MVRVRLARAGCAVVLCAAAGTVAALPAATPAGAIDGSTGIAGAKVAPSWQVNGVVHSITASGGVIYVGGAFTSVRPPGAPLGTDEVPRTGLAAFDAATGDLLTAFAPVIASSSSTPVTVYGLSTSADGSTVYASGQFTTVDGVAHSNVVAVNAADGSLAPWRTVVPTGIVYDVRATSAGVYLGGSFGVVNGVRRTNAALVDGSGVLQPWAPQVSGGAVRQVILNPDGSSVALAGSFTSVGGVAHRGLEAVDTSTGAPLASWGSGPALSATFQVYHAAYDASHIYVGGVDFGGKNEFDGTAALNWADGTPAWIDYCQGDTHGVALLRGVLYAGGHSHDCHRVAGGYPVLRTHQDLAAVSATDGTMLDWFPTSNSAPSSSPEQTGPRVLATDGTDLYAGGDFTQVNGLPQQGFARFTTTSDAAPSAPTPPTAELQSDGSVAIQVQTVMDADDGTLSYTVLRDGRTPVATVSASSRFWSLPVFATSDPAPPKGRHSYVVTVSDGTQSLTSRQSNAVTVGGTAPATWKDAVTASAPVTWWRLGDAPGATTAADSTSRSPGGLYTTSGVQLGLPGAMPSDANTSAAFDGSNGGAASRITVRDPQIFSAGIWFRTTTRQGGKLFGFGDKQTGLSNNYDRQVYMTNDGRLVFGVYSGGAQTLTTNWAYNDGRWHYAVGTLSAAGMSFYVDGNLIGSNSVTDAQQFVGYWRVGGDNVSGWPNQPTGGRIAAQLDEFSVWQYALSQTTVQQLYALGQQ